MRKKKTQSAAGPTQRQLRVGELIRHSLAELLVRGEIHDAIIASHVITIPEVRMSPDLTLATVYLMPLGGEDRQPVLEAFNRHKRFIRGEVSRRINLKFAPEIRFSVDDTFEEAARIDKLLASPEVKRDLERK
jgi:ribosome-binding factor A